MDDVFMTPFAIVVGTISEDPMMRRFCRLRAEYARAGWKEWQHAAPRYFLDSEITDEQLRQYSLVLYGGPEENLVTRKLIESLPLEIESDAITIGGEKFAARDAAVGMVYPNPYNPERSVVITAGNSAIGMFMTDHIPDNVDFAVVDAHVDKQDDLIPEEKIMIVSGSFDHNWQYAGQHVLRGDPAERDRAPERKAPRCFAADQVKGNSLMLSELQEAGAAYRFKEMRRDVNWEWNPIRLGGKTYNSGIGIHAAPEGVSVATYDLTGGGWKRLKARIGIEIKKPEELSEANKKSTTIWLAVVGDGRRLYRSPTFLWDSPPVDIDVDIEGIRLLELQVGNEAMWQFRVDSVNWADVRLER